jgi:hypothetical protein
MLTRLTRLRGQARVVPKPSHPRYKATSAADPNKSTGRLWIVDQVGMWPLIAVTALTVAYFGYEIYENLSSPEYQYNRQERRTINYIENDKDPTKPPEWAKSTLKAPELAQKLVQYPQAEDYKPDSKGGRG